MRKTRLLIAALLLISPFAANAVPITISGFGSADGEWDVTTLLCDRTQQSCIDELVSQVWYQNSALAQAFAEECFDCLGYPNQPLAPGFYTPWVNWRVAGSALGWAYFTGFGTNVAEFFGGDNEQYWMVADRVSVPEPGTLALLGIGLFGMSLARRKRTA